MIKYHIYKFFLLFLIVILVSCKFINNNNFKNLSYSQKLKVKQFNNALLLNEFLQQDTVDLFEITVEELQQVSKMFKFVLVKRWRPFCSVQQLETIKLAHEMSLKNPNFQFILISETFDFERISHHVKNLNFKLPVFVYPSSYGNKISKAREVFFSKITQDVEINTNIYSDYFFFVDSKLVLNIDTLSKKDLLGLIELADN